MPTLTITLDLPDGYTWAQVQADLQTSLDVVDRPVLMGECGQIWANDDEEGDFPEGVGEFSVE